MGYALPSGVVNTESVFYYPDTTFKLGPLVKEPPDQILVVIDYSQIIPAMSITAFDFATDVSSNPELVLSYPQLNPMGNVLTFLLSGGIVGQQYNINVRVYSNNFPRTDVLTINTPSFGDCACTTINPVPRVYSQIPLNSDGYVNTALRYFYGRTPPANPSLMDYWYDPTVRSLYMWATDGVTFFWELSSQENVVLEAPASNLMYSRYNKAWVPNVIQTEAPKDGQPYARFMGDWRVIPTIIADAPADDGYYARRNNAWIEDPNSSLPSSTKPLMDGVAAVGTDPNFARGDHVHPTDISLYPASNPANYTTGAQVIALLSTYAQSVDVPVPSNAVPTMAGIGESGSNPAYSRADHRHPSDTTKLALAGGIMGGMLTLAGDPVNGLDAATKQYIENAIATLKTYIDTALANAVIDCGTY